VTIDLKFDQEKEISLITISTLLDQEAWIFSPAKVTILNQDIEVGKVVLSNADKKQIQQLMYIDVPIIENTYSQLKIIVHGLEVIPDWHQGNGIQPWFFIDEILID
jgi:2',3'-cyclic-nucleotide 2'-phosphodiesterase (5'-nucleotidase family)